MTTFRTPRGENPPKDRARAKNLGEKIPYFSVPPWERRNAKKPLFSTNFRPLLLEFSTKSVHFFALFLQFFSPSPRRENRKVDQRALNAKK